MPTQRSLGKKNYSANTIPNRIPLSDYIQTFVYVIVMAFEPQVVEHFFGVYLLYCKNLKYKGRTYIGYTVDPKRRIKQHNAGKHFGGAWRTSNRGPWEMVLIVHGFPNSTSALRFEWAWQHPELSRRLKHVPKKKARQKSFEYCLTVLSAMLQVGPWCRLPLTVRWLDDEFGQQYADHLSPPLHMPITFGKVTSRKPKKDRRQEKARKSSAEEGAVELKPPMCHICSDLVDAEDRIGCVKSNCDLVAHLICLAELFRRDDMILPVEGCCPHCSANVLWGDLIRKKIGCNMHLQEEVDGDSDSSDD